MSKWIVKDSEGHEVNLHGDFAELSEGYFQVVSNGMIIAGIKDPIWFIEVPGNDDD